MEDLLIKVIEKTNGWVIVVVVGMYFVYQAFKAHEDGRVTHETLAILNQTIERLLKNVDQNVSLLHQKTDALIAKLGK